MLIEHQGAASEGDFHAGMLLASTIPSPTLFFARNNGFAISTPASEQFHGDGIASRGPGYGVDTIRVDGNDVLAVLSATRAARERCVDSGRAVLVEAMTYRVGHHSTSDDSFAYRSRSEVEGWVRADNPLSRFRLFLQSRGWWNDREEEEMRTRIKGDVLQALKRAEGKKRHELSELFTDIYAGLEPWNIVRIQQPLIHNYLFSHYLLSFSSSSRNSRVQLGILLAYRWITRDQKEQRKELGALLSKYGNAWEPWRNELAKFKGSGRELVIPKRDPN